MAGIGAISGGLPIGFVAPPRQDAEATGSRSADALGAKSGLGESASADSARDDNPNDRGLSGAARQLSDVEQQEVQELKQRDREVRQHEQAHVAAAGRYAQGGPQYEFTTGPDGRQYATGGHVNIDVSPASTPEATIQKAQVVRRAALAPAQPSGQDRAVAAQAGQLEAEARRELREAQQDGGEEEGAGESTRSVTRAGRENSEESSPLDPPPAISRRDVSQYQPDVSGQPSGAGGVNGISRLDLTV